MQILDETTNVKTSEGRDYADITTEIIGKGNSNMKGQILRYVIRTFPTDGFMAGTKVPERNFKNPETYVTEVKLNDKSYAVGKRNFRENDLENMSEAIKEHFFAVDLLREFGPRSVYERYLESNL